jgi:hypothetical protein
LVVVWEPRIICSGAIPKSSSLFISQSRWKSFWKVEPQLLQIIRYSHIVKGQTRPTIWINSSCTTGWWPWSVLIC